MRGHGDPDMGEYRPCDVAVAPIVTVERMAYDKVWEAKDLLIDACAMSTHGRKERAEVRRIISQAQRLLREAKALLP
jgi:hypothetical protein